MATYAKVVTESASGTIAQDTTGNAATATTASAAPYSGLTGSVPTWNQSTSGNAATATALASSGSVSIGGDITASGVTYSGGGNVSLSASVDDNVLDPANLKGPSSSALANGSNNQVLASSGDGTFKWVSQTSANNSTMTLTAGNGISGGGSFTGNQASASTVSFAFDGSELADGTADVVGSADELIYLDAGVSKRKMINEIKLGQFNNDAGWTSNAGTVTSVGTGKGLTGTVTSSGSLNLDFGGLDALASFSQGNALMGEVDMLVGYDDSADKAVSIGYGKIDLGYFSNNIGYTLNAIESISLTAGDGLTGGGSASSGAYSKTIAVGEGTGVTVAADTVSIGQDVATDAGVSFATVTTSGNVTVGGDLTVSGTTITTNTETLEIGDNKMVLNAGHTGTAVDTGLVIERGSSGNNQMLFWDESQSSFCVGNGSTTAFPASSAKLALQKVTGSLDTSDTTVPVGGMQVAAGVLYVRTA